jgi:hypothetical protein
LSAEIEDRPALEHDTSVFFIHERPAAGGYDAACFQADVTDHFAFQRPKRIFPRVFEDPRNGFSGPSYYLLVGINPGPVAATRNGPRHATFTRGHKADKDYVTHLI